MIRILHTADLHLGRSFASWGEQAASLRRSDLLTTLERIGQIAIEQSVVLVLIAGDLFDVHHPDGALVATVRGWLTRLADQRIHVVITPGNHDSYWYERSVYRDHHFPDNTHVFHDATCDCPYTLRIDGSDIHLYGIAHDHTRDRQPLTSLHRRCDDGHHIGLLHATVDPAPGFAVTDRYLPLTSRELEATGLDYVALGHIHRFRTFNDGRAGFAAQPGSPEPLAVDETGPRSVNIVSLGDSPPRIERVPVGVRTALHQEIDCTGLMQPEIVQSLRRQADPACILDAVLTGMPDQNLDGDLIHRELAGDFCYLSLADRTDVVDSAFTRAIESEQTIRGRFVRSLREQAHTASTDEERAIIELALKHGLLALAKRSIT